LELPKIGSPVPIFDLKGVGPKAGILLGFGTIPGRWKLAWHR